MNSTFSKLYELDRGVGQGSVLSPTLFNVFIDPLLRSLCARALQCGVSVFGVLFVIALAFADDVVTLAPTI